MTRAWTEDGRAAAERLVDAGFALIGAEGWRAFSLRRAAEEAGLALGDVYAVCADRAEFLEAAAHVFDARSVAALPAPAPGEGAHDRAFDAVMGRFDAMAPFRPAFQSLNKDLRRDPLLSARLAPAFRRAMAWTLEAAGVTAPGWRRPAQLRIFALLWLQVFAVWLKDDASQALTMAELDKRLRRARFLFPKTTAQPADAPTPAHGPAPNGAATGFEG